LNKLWHVIEFPLWMGVGGVNTIPTGAALLRAQLQPDIVIDVAAECDLSLVDQIKGKKALLASLAEVKEKLRWIEKPLLMYGGDCASDFPLVAEMSRRYLDELAVIWIDAHADLNTPSSSPSGNFHGMVLRALLGEGDADVAQLHPHPLLASQVFYVGVREWDQAERERAREIPRFSVAEMCVDPAALIEAVQKAGFRYVHVHCDFDVLDPAYFASTAYPSDDGFKPDELRRLLSKLASHFNLVSAAFTEYAPIEKLAQQDVALLVMRGLIDLPRA
jgi:arginase